MKIPLSMLLLASLVPCSVMAAEGIRSNAATGTGTANVQSVPDRDPETAAAAVTKALRESRELNASKISVATHASIVVLSGSVTDEAQAARANSIAERAADGVRVSSNIQVDQPVATLAPSSSAQVVRDVETALRQDARTAKLQVTVGIDDQQTVQLGGLVPSAADRAAAEAVAARVKGVRRVENGLIASER